MGRTYSRVLRSRLPTSKTSVAPTWEKIFVSYERKVTFILFSEEGEMSLVNLSKCFLANRDNFFPYEQPVILFFSCRFSGFQELSISLH